MQREGESEEVNEAHMSPRDFWWASTCAAVMWDWAACFTIPALDGHRNKWGEGEGEEGRREGGGSMTYVCHQKATKSLLQYTDITERYGESEKRFGAEEIHLRGTSCLQKYLSAELHI